MTKYVCTKAVVVWKDGRLLRDSHNHPERPECPLRTEQGLQEAELTVAYRVQKAMSLVYLPPAGQVLYDNEIRPGPMVEPEMTLYYKSKGRTSLQRRWTRDGCEYNVCNGH